MKLNIVNSIALALTFAGAASAETTDDVDVSQTASKSAVTVWWVVFNNPTACTTAPDEEIKCGSSDLAIEAAEPAAIWAAGDVADSNGNLFLTAGLYRTADPLILDSEIDFKGLQRGWTSPDAEIHLVVRDHGPVVAEDDGYLEQIMNFNDQYEGCCTNVQAAPFASGQDGEKTVYVMSDKTDIDGTRAILKCRGDLIQAVIETVDPALVAMEEISELPVSPKAAPEQNAPKSTVTVWWVIFNNPSACTTAPGEAIACGSADLAIEAAEPAAIWAAGGIADDEGKLHLTSGLYRTADPLLLDSEIDFKGLQRGWTSPDAEVHLVVRNHGPVVTANDGYLEQVMNFNDQYTGCCSNEQAAPFASGEEGEKTLYIMSDKQDIKGTRAVLNRRDDLLQFVIETIDPAMQMQNMDEMKEEEEETTVVEEPTEAIMEQPDVSVSEAEPEIMPENAIDPSAEESVEEANMDSNGANTTTKGSIMQGIVFVVSVFICFI